jgi:hypothetical protein
VRRWLLTPLVASLFVVSFIESWAALVHAAQAAAIPYDKPWPWMVDGFIVAMALSVIEADREHRGKVALWPRVGLVVATGLSTGIQAAWAPQQDWAWALHAWSPLAVLFSFECLVWLWRPAWDEPPVPLGPRPKPEPDPDPDQPEPVQSRPRVAQGGPRRERPATLGRPVAEVAQRAAQGHSAARIVRDLGLSDRARTGWVADLVREHRPTPAQLGHPNGSGGGS